MLPDNAIQYKGLTLKKPYSSADEKAELLLDQIIRESRVGFSEEKVENELKMEMAGLMQTMRYRAMGGDHQLEETSLEEWTERLRREIIRDHQAEEILRLIIREEQIQVSEAELRQAAEALAEEEHTTLEMVRRFMGEDYALLKKDVLNKKARAFLAEASP